MIRSRNSIESPAIFPKAQIAYQRRKNVLFEALLRKIED